MCVGVGPVFELARAPVVGVLPVYMCSSEGKKEKKKKKKEKYAGTSSRCAPCIYVFFRGKTRKKKKKKKSTRAPVVGVLPCIYVFFRHIGIDVNIGMKAV